MDAKHLTRFQIDPSHDLTPMGEMLRMALDADELDMLLLTKGEHLERIAAHLACVRGLEATGHPLKFSELPTGLKMTFTDIAHRAITFTDPDHVADCIREAWSGTEDWLNGPGNAKDAAPSTEDICREAIYRFIAALAAGGGR